MNAKNLPIKIGIVADAVSARNFYKLLFRFSDLEVSGIYEVDFRELEGLQKYKEFVMESPEEVMNQSEVLILQTNDLVYDQKIMQIAFDHNISVITGFMAN
jgi:hypothetical protein